jgi:hypothetical protein
VADIEEENLENHERPMSLEHTLPVRAHYKHMNHGLEDVIQGYSTVPWKQKALRISNDAAARKIDDDKLKNHADGDRIISENDL